MSNTVGLLPIDDFEATGAHITYAGTIWTEKQMVNHWLDLKGLEGALASRVTDCGESLLVAKRALREACAEYERTHSAVVEVHDLLKLAGATIPGEPYKNVV